MVGKGEAVGGEFRFSLRPMHIFGGLTLRVLQVFGLSRPVEAHREERLHLNPICNGSCDQSIK